MTDTKPNTPDTSSERIAQICDAFAVDLQHSCDVDNATDALKALVAERDQLRAELAESRSAALNEALCVTSDRDFHSSSDVRVWGVIHSRILALKANGDSEDG